jgi:subtilisin family serine protease
MNAAEWAWEGSVLLQLLILGAILLLVYDLLQPEISYHHHFPLSNGFDDAAFAIHLKLRAEHIENEFRKPATIIWIVDTGIEQNHPLFVNDNYVLPGPSFVVARPKQKLNPLFSAADTDPNGHGTFLASNIRKHSNDSIIVSIAAVGPSGEGEAESVAFALEWVADMSKHVSTNQQVILIALSATNDYEGNSEYGWFWGYIPYRRSNLRGVLTSFWQQHEQFLIIQAAGNYGTNSCYVGEKSRISRTKLIVGSVNKFSRVSYFSNYGECLDLFAPGTFSFFFNLSPVEIDFTLMLVSW